MSDELGGNLARIVAAWTDLFRRGSTDALKDLLDENVVWNGMFPDEICHDRHEVLGIPGRNQPHSPRVTRIEAKEHGDKVAVTLTVRTSPATIGDLPVALDRSCSPSETAT